MNAIDPTMRAKAAADQGVAEEVQGARILVVDDVPDNREVLTRRLVRRGFTVVEAGGGIEALEAVGREPFDVVLLDIMMPDLSGNEVLRKIRETLSDTELPIIMVSAKSQSEDVVESLELGANDYVTKPVDFAVAMARITTQVARKRAADAEREEKHTFAQKAAKLTETVAEKEETLRRTAESLESESRQRQQSEERLRYLAYHDGLTGLLNRSAFRDYLREEIRVARSADRDLAVIFIDLDRFKAVNDVHGHEAGDRLLKAVGGRLTQILEDRALVARLGGDEFAVILPYEMSRESGAGRARAIVEALSEPFQIAEQTFQVGASCGMSWLTDCDADFDVLMKGADLAMYGAKHGGRNRHVVYEPAMLEEQKERSKLEVDLRKAIQSGTLELHYQPLMNSKSGEITSFEALLRWPHADHGMIGPDRFIPIAEDTGLIIPMGAWVFHQACAEAASWPSHVRVAVNLSPVQFRDKNLLETLRAALTISGLDPKRLEVEITESALLESGEHNVDILRSIRDMGIRVSMDDFGTGYSSMAYLQQFDFDKIKIDRRFVDGLSRGPNSAAIIQAVVQLGVTIGVDTTAEGVENEEQLMAIRSHGCTEMQGYYFSKPMPAVEARKFLADSLLLSAG